MTEQGSQEIKNLKQENKKLRDGINKAIADLHNWANSSGTGKIYNITLDLRGLVKRDEIPS